MLAQIPCVESNECKLADYLVDVLGDVNVLKKYMASASEKIDAQSNALERFAASKLETKPLGRRTGNEYQRITNAVQQKFEVDFEYILGARNRTRDYLIPLLEFYYFTYTAQAALQLNRFLDGERNKCIPLYFCLEWEKTSQNRHCFSEGWSTLQDAVTRIFVHAITLEILNQTEDGVEPVDYIKLQELIRCAPGEDHRIAEQIKVMAFKLKTSKKAAEIIDRIEGSEYLQCYTLVKLAIALSLRSKEPLRESDFHTNTLGRELNRQTIMGDADALYKCLMELHAQKHLTDEDFFPSYVKAHIDRGAILLDQEQRYGGDFLIHLTELEKSL